jgi:hypothetical protein
MLSAWSPVEDLSVTGADPRITVRAVGKGGRPFWRTSIPRTIG